MPRPSNIETGFIRAFDVQRYEDLVVGTDVPVQVDEVPVPPADWATLGV
jgi:hypothetical protein